MNEADLILILHREDQVDVNLIIVEKNRHGETGEVRCLFDKSTAHWKDFDVGYGLDDEQ